MKNKIKILFSVFLLFAYLIYGHFILQPQLFRNYSLIDDGQVIVYSQNVARCLLKHNCERLNAMNKTEESGRLRLIYWLIQSPLYSWNTPIGADIQHIFRVYFFGGTIVTLFLLIAHFSKVGKLATTLGLAIFVTNYSFSENLIRLGPIEPYQVILLAVFSLLYLFKEDIFKRTGRWAHWAIAFTFILLLLAKETSIVVLLVVIMLELFFPSQKTKKMTFLLVIISLVVLLLMKLLSGNASGVGANYVGDYNLNIKFIFQNAKQLINVFSLLTLPFIKVLAIALLVGVFFKPLRKLLLTKELLYWLFLTGLSVAIYFPWKYILDRYLLMPVFCLSLTVAITFSKYLEYFRQLDSVKSLYHFIIPLVLLGFSFFFFRGFPVNFVKTINYRNWYAAFNQFEGDQIAAIAKANVNKIFINATDDPYNWEVMYELPIHLKLFYNFDLKVEKYDGSKEQKGLLLSRNLMDNKVPMDQLKGLKLYDSKEYFAEQIDPIMFRNKFQINAYDALISPPETNKARFIWELRII